MKSSYGEGIGSQVIISKYSSLLLSQTHKGNQKCFRDNGSSRQPIVNKQANQPRGTTQWGLEVTRVQDSGVYREYNTFS